MFSDSGTPSWYWNSRCYSAVSGPAQGLEPVYDSESLFVWKADVVEHVASKLWTFLSCIGSLAGCRAAVSMVEEMSIDWKSASFYICTPCQGPILLPLELLFLFLPSRVSLFAHFSYSPDLTPLLFFSASQLELFPLRLASTLCLFSFSFSHSSMLSPDPRFLHTSSPSISELSLVDQHMYTCTQGVTVFWPSDFYNVISIMSKISSCCLKSFLIEVLTRQNNPGSRWWYPHGRMVFQGIQENVNLKHRQDIFFITENSMD